MESKKILIVEDEEMVAQDIKELLEDEGYCVLGPSDSGQKAISIATQTPPDIILMDVNLGGGIDGIETANEILKNASIPVVFVTAYSDDETLKRIKVTEPYGYILKPYKPVDLLTTIEIALHQHERSQKGGEGREELEIEGDVVRNTPGSNQHEEFLAALQKLPTLQELSEESLSVLAQFCTKKTYAQNEIVNFEGDSVKSGFIVKQGTLAVMKSSSSGKELIVELMAEGDPFGLICSLDKQPYPYTTKAIVDTELVWIPRSTILQTLDTNPQIAQRFYRETFGRLRNSHDLARSLAHDKVEIRVAAALLSLYPKFTHQEEELQDSVPLSRQDLADITGTTQETCIRVTRSLEKKGLLDLSKNKLIKIKDKDGLEDLVLSG